MLLGLSELIETPRIKAHAEDYALHYAHDVLYLPDARVSCTGKEDHQGYVPCSVTPHPGALPVQIECVANSFFESKRGCTISLSWLYELKRR